MSNESNRRKSIPIRSPRMKFSVDNIKNEPPKRKSFSLPRKREFTKEFSRRRSSIKVRFFGLLENDYEVRAEKLLEN